MSDTPTPADIAPKAPADEPAQADEVAAEAEETDWKAEARKWEQRAKENKAAADELASIREASKTEAEKAAERLANAEREAAEAKAAIMRRDIALEHKLSKDDAALLDAVTDEDAMRSLAGRLAALQVEDKSPRPPRPDPNQGRTGGSVNTSPADLFAQAMQSVTHT